ncbi:nuclease-related domain-containing protein [Bacillus rubiinfantis]|uniref:nuclease-related domain-containing protein n=1 Tax=Bacillus rubiinfantis TaxID=1499680 RepID=UPI0005A9CEC6|nr:nuclease-related domain-containing protein [Bacillus rubiinfantis]
MRPISKEFKISRIIHARGGLSDQGDWNYYTRLEKGFEGELTFDKLTDKLQNDCVVIKGLLLEVNNSEFQIDTLIIFQRILYLIDVKNYEGDYYYEKGLFYRATGNINKDPLMQLNRCKTLFLQLLQQLDFHFSVEPLLVFVNPELTLMQAPRDFPIVFPTQLNRFLKKLEMIPSRLNGVHRQLSERLIALHKEESSNMRLPAYDFQHLDKGVMCQECRCLSTAAKGKFLVCSKCGHQELVDSAVLRSVAEIRLLFPGERITTNLVYEWCGIVKSKKTIRRILSKHLNKKGYGQWTYYE